MKLNAYEQDVLVSGGDTNTTQATAEVNGAAFAILSDGIYEHKIAAIVREVCHNARDSHIEAGKADVPFRVVLPNKFNQNFVVEDYGIGLSDEEVREITLAYFKSLKNHTNELVGGFGLGFKTPFCYSNSFFITAIKDYRKNTYVAYIGSSGIPELKCLSSDEEVGIQNGVTIKVPVDDKDQNRFRNEAAYILSFFDTRPIVEGGEDFDFYLPEEKMDELDKEGFIAFKKYNHSSLYGGRAYAMMSGVCYKLPDSVIPDTSMNLLHILYSMGHTFVFQFKSGELFPAASRESLSMKDGTEEFLQEHIATIVNRLLKETQAKVDQASSIKEAIETVMADFDTTGALQYFKKYGKDLRLSFNRKRKIPYDCRILETTSSAGTRRFHHYRGRSKNRMVAGISYNSLFSRDREKIYCVAMNEGDKKTPFKKYIGHALEMSINENQGWLRGGIRCVVFDYVLSEHKKKRIETLFGEDRVIWVDWKTAIPEKSSQIYYSDLNEKTDTTIYSRIIKVHTGEYCPSKADNHDIDFNEYDVFYIDKEEEESGVLSHQCMKTIDPNLKVIVFIKTKRNAKALEKRGVPHYSELVHRYINIAFDSFVVGTVLSNMVGDMETLEYAGSIGLIYSYDCRFLDNHPEYKEKLSKLNEHFTSGVAKVQRPSREMMLRLDRWSPGFIQNVREKAKEHEGTHEAKALDCEIQSKYGDILPILGYVDRDVQLKLAKKIDFCLRHGYHDKQLAIIDEGENV